MGEKDQPEVPIEIIRTNPDNLSSLHVNDMHIFHSAVEFYITFSQIVPPIGFSAETDKEIEAVAKGKFVMTPQFVETMSEVINSTIEHYKKNMEDIIDGEDRTP